MLLHQTGQDFGQEDGGNQAGDHLAHQRGLDLFQPVEHVLGFLDAHETRSRPAQGAADFRGQAGVVV